MLTFRYENFTFEMKNCKIFCIYNFPPDSNSTVILRYLCTIFQKKNNIIYFQNPDSFPLYTHLHTCLLCRDELGR